jgi:hypothetical protein
VNPGQVARRAYDNAKTFGLGASVRDIAYLTAQKLMDVRILKGMTAQLADIDPSLFAAGAFTTRFATAPELRAAVQCPEWQCEMSPAFVEDALAKGDRCYGIFDAGRMVSMGWYSRTPTLVTETMSLHFDPAWAYMYKGYTLPDYRGRRLHGVGMSLACRAYTEEGARGLISYVEFNNLSSLRSVERMGYRIFGDIYLTTIGGTERTWSSPGCRRYAFRLEPAAGRTARS